MTPDAFTRYLETHAGQLPRYELLVEEIVTLRDELAAARRERDQAAGWKAREALVIQPLELRLAAVTAQRDALLAAVEGAVYLLKPFSAEQEWIFRVEQMLVKAAQTAIGEEAVG